MEVRPITPLTRPFAAEVTPPGSKSLTNRALVLAALGRGRSELTNCLLADDTRAMLDGLCRLGYALEADEAAGRISVEGTGGAVPAKAAELACGNSGTTIRFLTALCTLGTGRYRLDGVPRMRQRPIGELADLLRNLGARVEFPETAGFPPLDVLGDGLPGGIARFGQAASSQYLSAVLQVCPYARHEVKIDLDWPVTSWPYVAMTMRLMDHFGSTPEVLMDKVTGNPRQIIIPREPLRAADYEVEPDASSATYFLALAALHRDARITIRGLGRSSLQGDVGFAELLGRMGARVEMGQDQITVTGTGRLEGIDVDLAAMPDTAQTLAVVALFADGASTLRGLGTLRVKETDRIAALAAELTKLGAEVEAEADSLAIAPPARPRPATIATYEDHRMAMSFALAGTRIAGVAIADPGCVSKTYPGFFGDLERVTSLAG